LLDAGGCVVITGRDAESLAQAKEALAAARSEGCVHAIRGDFTDRSTIESAYRETLERFGRIDHLIANLGAGSGTAGVLPSAEDWTRLFEVNFFGSVRLTETVIPEMRKQGSGNIVYISSIVAVEATPAPLPYSAAKAALNNYAKNLARQVAGEGIRVNTICPGNIFFPGGSWERHLETRKTAVEEMLLREVPQGRFGTPEEIASLVVYLCSPQAGFATGGTFVMDGGQTRSY
jgi:3-oxoacyl-[acyl-carrier protein] reductase